MKPYLQLTQPEQAKRNERSMHLIRYILASVDRSLLLAESQNGALLAMNIALIRAFKSTGEIGSLTIPVIAMLLGSIAIASSSFYPRIFQDEERKCKKGAKSSRGEGNLLDFHVISTRSTASYLRELYALEGIELSDLQNLPQSVRWFADELVVKSRITVMKHRLFRFALSVTVLACVMKLGEILLTL